MGDPFGVRRVVRVLLHAFHRATAVISFHLPLDPTTAAASRAGQGGFVPTAGPTQERFRQTGTYNSYDNDRYFYGG